MFARFRFEVPFNTPEVTSHLSITSLVVILEVSILPNCTIASVSVRFPPVDPVKDPVAKRILSSLSSHPMKTLSALPLSMTIPESPDGDPVVPDANSMILSEIVVFVVLTVVVVPLTVRFPLISRLPPR